MAKKKISAAVRERLRKMREKFGLGEYKNKTSNVKKVSRRKKRVISMVRRRSVKRSSGMGGLGGGKLMNGLFKPKGLIQSAFNGIAAAHLAGYIPVANDFKYKEEAAGFIAGGAVGAAAVYAIKNMSTISNKGSSNNPTLN